MATKAAVKKPEKNYPRISFSIEQSNWCCGLGEVGNFVEDTDAGWMWGSNGKYQKKPSKPFSSLKEQAKACLTEIYKSNDENYTYGQLFATFVSKYEGTNKAQFPELVEAMLKDGWTEVARWVNPNHGNELIMLTKTLQDVIERRLTEENYDEYEDEEDDGEWD